MCQRGTCKFSKPSKETAEIETGMAESPGGTSVRCFKQIWKVGRVGKVGKVHVGKVGKVHVGKVDRVVKVGKVGKEGRLRE